MNRIIYRVIGFLALSSIFLIWQLVSVLNILPSTLFPSAVDVLRSFYIQVANGTVLSALIASLTRLFEGYILAAILGIAVGVAIGLNPTAEKAISPLVQFFRPLPSITYIPLVILYFGLGPYVVILPVMIGCFWPILINTVDGVKSIDPMVLETARLFRVKGLDRLKKIILPASAVFIFSGLRISLAVAWVVTITAEFLIVVFKNGLGVLIFYYLNAGNLTATYGMIVSVGVIAYLLNRAFLGVEDLVLPWFKKRTKGVGE